MLELPLGFIVITPEAVNAFLDKGVPGVLALIVLVLVSLIWKMIIQRDKRDIQKDLLTERIIILAEKQAEASAKTQVTMECQCRLLEKHNEAIDKLADIVERCSNILDP